MFREQDYSPNIWELIDSEIYLLLGVHHDYVTQALVAMVPNTPQKEILPWDWDIPGESGKATLPSSWGNLERLNGWH